MAQYYSGSEICIAAAAAAHVQHGIIQPRPLGHISTSLEGKGDGLLVREVADDVLSLIAYYQWRAWRPSIQFQPLQTRSWALQERIFAKRIVSLHRATDDMAVSDVSSWRGWPNWWRYGGRPGQGDEP